MRRWTCEHCGASAAPIEVLQCPKCGHYRDTSAYSTPELSDPAHWVCDCGAPNWSADPYCMRCGTTRPGYSYTIDRNPKTPRRRTDRRPLLIVAAMVLLLIYYVRGGGAIC